MEKGDLFEKRKRLYKGQSPHWKETYRQRCHDRLKKSRDKFMTRLRKNGPDGDNNNHIDDKSLVKDLMVQEWKLLSREQTGLPVLMQQDDAFEFEAENIDEVMSVFEEIRKELLEEEQQILREYESGLLFDEEALTAAIECLKTDEVICPLCEKSPLMLNKGYLFCRCGLRVCTEQDCITLDFVQHNLEEGVSTHSDQCKAKPKFNVVNSVGVENLMMTCDICDFMFIVV